MSLNKLTSQGNLRRKIKINPVILRKNINVVFNHWRERGFPYYSTNKKFRDNEFKKFMKVDDFKSVDYRLRLLKSNISGLTLAWSYFKNAMEVRCNENHSPIESFNDDRIFKIGIRKILEGVFFKKCSVKELTAKNRMANQNILSLLRRVSGSQMVSNFRCVTASVLYKIFAKKNKTVWDMSCGWGGRLFGAIKSKVNYIGTEPAKETYNNLQNIIKDYGNKNNRYKIYCCGSEEFKPKKESLDFAFTSPPYFDCEKYSNDKNQSYLKFKSQRSWKYGFLKKTLQNVHHGLKKNHFTAINIANVKSYQSLENDTKSVAEEVGLKLVDTWKLQLSSQQEEFKTEPIFIFKKI